MNRISTQRICLVLLTALGLTLRIAYLDSDDAWWDELVTATRALLPLDQLWTSLRYQGPSLVSTDCAPPLHHFFIHFSLLLGHSDFFLKLPNALFGTATIPAVYFLARRLLGNPAAWYAAIFVCLSSFHVSYSRDARWYSLFFFCAVSSFYFLMTALQDGREKNWFYFILFSTLMCWTSYTAAVYIASYIIIFASWAVFCGDKTSKETKTAVFRFLLSLTGILILYSPWIAAQINTYYAFHDPNISRPFSLALLVKYFRLFLAPFFFNPSYLDGLTVLFVAGGIAAMLSRKLFLQCLALLVWTFLPILAAHKAKIAFEISPRYIISVLLFMACMTAASADGLGRLAAMALDRWKTGVQVLVGLAVVLSVGSFSFRFYPGLWFDSDNSYKPFLSWLARNKFNTDYLLYAKSRQHKAIVDWYLPGLYKGLDSFDTTAYKRCVVMESRDRSQPPAAGVTAFDEYGFHKMGLVNRSPLVIAPGPDGTFEYSCDFKTFQTYQDASNIDNICVLTDFKELALYDPVKPGSITFTFADPSNRKVESLTAEVALHLDRVEYIEPDCVLTLSVVDPRGDKHVLASKTALDFSGGARTLSFVSTLDTRSMPSGAYKLILDFTNGKRMGFIAVSGLNVAMKLDPRADLPVLDATAEYARNIAANSRLNSWSGEILPGSRSGPYSFDLGSSQGLEQREHYLALHPGSSPVYVLRDEHGDPRWEYYDPWLTGYSIPMRAGHPVTLGSSPDGRGVGRVSSYTLTGRMVFPKLAVNGQESPLTLNTPAGARVDVNAGGKGRITLRPVFMDGLFSPRSIDRYDSIATLPGQDCLTCSGQTGCTFSYGFQSAFPVESLRLVWHPRLFSDKLGKNSVRATLSLDGAAPVEIGRFDGKRTDGWDGPDRMVSRLTLSKPANRVELTFHLTSDATQVWSNQTLPLVIDAVIDCRNAPVLDIPAGASLTVTGDAANDFGLIPSDSPIPFFDRLEYMH